MAENKKSFLLYSDIITILEVMDDTSAGKLFKTIVRYVNDENPKVTDPIVNVAFQSIRNQLKRDLRRYEEKKAGNSKGAYITNLKRYRPDLYKKYKNGSLKLEDAVHEAKTGEKPRTEKTNTPLKNNISNEQIKMAWNEFFANTTIPKIKLVTDKRRKAFLNIYNSVGGVENLNYIMLKAKASTFLCNGTFFSFDWFFTKSNFIKVMEGNFDDKINNSKPTENRANEILKQM